MVTYRLATEHDYENINQFHNRIYKKHRTMEQFRWEFHDGPFGAAIYVIALDGEKVIGTNCVIPIELIHADGSISRTGKSEDTLVDPDYRGQNIFYNIYDFLFEKCSEAGIEVIWGFTSAIKPFKKLGFEIPFDHEQSLAVNKVFASSRFIASLNEKNKALDKFKIFGLCLMSKFKLIGKKPKDLKDFRVEENPVSEGVSELNMLRQKNAGKIFTINQNAAFQDWRVYQNPNYFKTHTYSFYNKENVLVGVIVMNSHANHVAYINHCAFHSNLSERDKASLLKCATARAFGSGISLVRNWIFDTNSMNKEEKRIHELAGHTCLARGIGFVWKEMVPFKEDANNFYLSRIATQGVI